jgi:hypothetical protein
MSSVKRHLKASHGGDEQHSRVAAKSVHDLVAQKGDDVSAADLAKVLQSYFDALAGHKNAMSQHVDTLNAGEPQGALVGPLTMNQPYLDRPAGTGKASDADDLNKLVPDHVRNIIGEIPEGVRAIPRNGQPPLGQRPNVPLGMEKYVPDPEDENSLY